MTSVDTTSFFKQMRAAGELELCMIAKLQDMEKRGIVKHGIQDEWIVLDEARWAEEMQMPVPENNHAR